MPHIYNNTKSDFYARCINHELGHSPCFDDNPNGELSIIKYSYFNYPYNPLLSDIAGVRTIY